MIQSSQTQEVVEKLLLIRVNENQLARIARINVNVFSEVCSVLLVKVHLAITDWPIIVFIVAAKCILLKTIVSFTVAF